MALPDLFEVHIETYQDCCIKTKSGVRHWPQLGLNVGRPGAQKFYSREKGQSARPHKLIQKKTSIPKMDCCRVLRMTFTSKSAFLVCNFLHLFKDIAPRLKLVLNDSLAPLESRMTNDSNFRCDIPSDSNLGR